MHELSIALSLIDVASEQAEMREVQVVAVHVAIGPLSGVVPEALLSAYEQAKRRTRLSQARLIIREAPIVAWCPACQSERQIASPQRLVCPKCGAPTPEVRSGRDLEIVELEVVDDVANPNGPGPAESAEAE